MVELEMIFSVQKSSPKYIRKRLTYQGFTLIELLVVIVVIGILSSIALPSFLNQTNKARQSEAKALLGAMNRAQQAYYMENLTFADNAALSDLGLGIVTQTENYLYTINGGDSTSVTNQAQPGTTSRLKAYIGGVQINTANNPGETLVIAILCESSTSPIEGGADGTEAADFSGTEPACPSTYRAVQ